ncbi:C_GCAxxG_C_C family protein [Desulfovibrio sp. DV]|uniref:C-GCAxxG-C-C family protein n=1 Tax=Desulfovibrio sp. DV TaxID=1844708 RepID=UPI00094BA7C9|nr:C-GCAxxG-C-C family protein [Desulfovibrio sp. DV]OLN28126.1 C_GCAxxG_C_C family protein [Desulfovibrio sp. DV]
METQEVEQRAQELFESGLNCAEAVLTAVLAGQGVEECEQAARLGTAFGAGVGRSKEEMCGALSGGLIALGYLQGRSGGDEGWDGLAALAAGVRNRFKAAHGCTSCASLLARFGPQESMDKCIRLSARTAGLFHDALRNPETVETAAAACGCATRQAGQTATGRCCG